tara:strand:- start:1010 stop:1474 length:465 start_codon:yes stop_codon:yes gene_type:complete
MFRDTVNNLLDEALEEREDLFLISLDVLSDNAIKIIIDGDKGVIVEDCIFISRAIENNLDREEQDFSLEVLSAGATEPLVSIRQYMKNIGRTLSVKTKENETIEGALTQVNESNILLEWKTREPKPIGKGKVTVKKQSEIAYDAILKAQVVIKF